MVVIDQTALGTYWDKITTTRTGPCSVQIKIRTSSRLPFALSFPVPKAPAIDWDYILDVKVLKANTPGKVRLQGTLSGYHDGFPAHEFFVADRRIHEYMPWITDVYKQFPPMDIAVASNFDVIVDGDLSCCECKGD